MNRFARATFRSMSLVCVAMLAGLCGCAAGLPYDTVRSTTPALEGIDGRIFFYRLDGDGERVATSVRVDGEVAGRAVPGGFFYIDRPAGDYRITASRNTNRVTTVRLVAGEELYVRIDFRMRRSDWLFSAVQIAEDVAIAELRGTVYVGQ